MRYKNEKKLMHKEAKNKKISIVTPNSIKYKAKYNRHKIKRCSLIFSYKEANILQSLIAHLWEPKPANKEVYLNAKTRETYIDQFFHFHWRIKGMECMTLKFLRIFLMGAILPHQI